MHTYVAIDPGETIGWATFDDEGDVVAYGQCRMENATKELGALIHDNVKHVIIEEYKNYSHKRQKMWGKNETSKVIGKIETLCELKDIPYTRQMATVKQIGYMWAGLGEAPKNHSISHQFDAIAHGVYWLQSNNIRPVGKAMRKND